jgi:alanine adding enzyme
MSRGLKNGRKRVKINSMEFCKLTAREFRAFALRQANASFTQSVEFAAHRQNLGWETEFWGVKRGGKVAVAALVAWRRVRWRTLGDIYGGPIGDFSDLAALKIFAVECKKMARRRGAVYVSVNPTQPLCELTAHGETVNFHQYIEQNFMAAGFQKNHRASVVPHFVFIKKLPRTDSPAELFRGLSSSVKTAIKNAEKNHITTRQIQPDEFPKLKKLMSMTAQRQNFQDRDLAFYQSLAQAFHGSKDYQVEFWLAEMDLQKLAASYNARQKTLQKDIKTAATPGAQQELKNQLVALQNRQNTLKNLSAKNQLVTISAGVYVKSKRETVYLFGGSDPQYLAFNGVYLLIWQQLLATQKSGVPVFNFYGVSGRFDGSDNLLNFKRAWQGEVREYMGPWELPVAPLKHGLIKLRRRIK